MVILDAGALLSWLPVPRCCPVDDAPHTTCTSPDYVGSHYPPGTLAVQMVTRPGALAAMQTAAPVVDSVSAPFTTATYRRPHRKVRP